MVKLLLNGDDISACFYIMYRWSPQQKLSEKYTLNAYMHLASPKLSDTFILNNTYIILYECQSQMKKAEPRLLSNPCKYIYMYICFTVLFHRWDEGSLYEPNIYL